MIPIYSKILTVPFSKEFRENLCSYLIKRHELTQYCFSESAKNLEFFNYTNINKKLFFSKGYNFTLPNNELSYFSEYLYDEFYKICCVIFKNFKLSINNSLALHPYISNKYDFRGGIHNHTITSIINAVYYIKIPDKNSGEICFYDEEQNLIYTHYPKEDELIIFPNYLNHMPQRSNFEEYRIAINIEFNVSGNWENPKEYKIKVIEL